MHSMQIMTQTYQIGYHLHMMPCSTLPGILNGVNAHKATGTDEVLARLLKEAADQFAPICCTFVDGSDRFAMTGIKLLVLKGNHHIPNL